MLVLILVVMNWVYSLKKKALAKSDAVVSYWGTEDIQSDFEHFLKIGATIHEAPQNVGGEIVVAAIKDPWDNVIGLIYNPEFKLG